MVIGSSILINWKRTFLQKRGLDRPSGEDLYTYKMTSEEFNCLEKYLGNWVKEVTIFRSASNLIGQVLFDQLFVLYASEWWKRKFSGGHWTWDQILHDIHINHSDWSAPKRSECVENGFKAWGIGLNNSGGKRFLGSVAIQGGLPINLIAENNGAVVRVLHRVFDLVSGSTVDFELISTWVENLSYYLPKTYQQVEIYHLLAQVIIVLTDLKSHVNSNDPLILKREWEDHSSKWLRKFPLSVGDDNTSSIIENLIKKVAHASTPRVRKGFISFERELEVSSESYQSLYIKINLEPLVEIESLKQNFEISNNFDLSSFLVVEIKCGDQVKEIGLRKLVASDKYKFSTNVIAGFSGVIFNQKVIVTLRDKDGNSWTSKNLQAEELCADLPWIFLPNEDGTYIFQGQGSQDISDKKFVVVLHNDININTHDVYFGFANIFDEYKAYEFDGDATFINRGNEVYRVRTRFSGIKKFIKVVGDSLSHISLNPRNAFRGMPKVYIENEDGVRSIESFRIKMGDRKFIPTSSVFKGPVEAIIESGNITRWKQKMIIFPEDSSEELVHSDDPHKGCWRLKNWEVSALRSVTSDVTLEPEGQDIWQVIYNGQGKIPETFQAQVLWEGNAKSAVIELPFPSQGVQVYNSKNEVIDSGDLISVLKTQGIRLNIIPGSSKSVKIEIGSNRSVLRSINFDDGVNSKQLRLIDFKNDFEKYLSLTHDLDAEVLFTVYFDDRREFQLRVTRYSFKLYQLEDRWYIPQEILRKIRDKSSELKLFLKAQRLDIPGVADLDVEYRQSGHVVIPDEMKSEGPWLIYSSKDSNFMMRPTLVPVWNEEDKLDDTDSNKKGLASAISENDKTLRLKSLEDAINEMVSDPDHYDWNILARLISEFGHLPLSSIDVWGKAIHNFDFMAMLVCGHVKLDEHFIDRFAFELPFMFEFIPIKSFEKAIREQVVKLKPYLSTDEIYSIIQRKYTTSVWVYSSFEFSYRLALNNVLVAYDREIEFGNSDLIQKMMFSGNDSYYQQLRHSHELNNSIWPSFNDLYDAISDTKPKTDSYFKMNEEYRTVTINTPFMLATWAYKGLINRFYLRSDYVMMYRKLKEFDEHWFIHAFNKTLLKYYYEDHE